jgi:hypothetical protein
MIELGPNGLVLIELLVKACYLKLIPVLDILD